MLQVVRATRWESDVEKDAAGDYSNSRPEKEEPGRNDVKTRALQTTTEKTRHSERSENIYKLSRCSRLLFISVQE